MQGLRSQPRQRFHPNRKTPPSFPRHGGAAQHPTKSRMCDPFRVGRQLEVRPWLLGWDHSVVATNSYSLLERFSAYCLAGSGCRRQRNSGVTTPWSQRIAVRSGKDHGLPSCDQVRRRHPVTQRSSALRERSRLSVVRSTGTCPCHPSCDSDLT